MTNKIDKLKTEVDEMQNLLEELKGNVSLSEDEKIAQAEPIKAQAEVIENKINGEIAALEDKSDEESKNKKEEAKSLLNSFNKIMDLYASILNRGSTDTTTKTKEDKEKGFFGKTKDWIGEQWDDVWNKDKWGEEWGKNLLRTAGFAVTGVGAIALVVKGIKRLFGKDKKKEESNEKDSAKDKKEKKGSWWKRFLIGAGITAGAVFGGVEVFKHWNIIVSFIKEKLGLVLDFDKARQKVEDEVRNGKIDDDHFGAFNANFENGIKFDTKTQEICSYDQKTRIDKEHKKLVGLDVEFASYEELIHAANIVNFAKRKLRGRGENARPFGQTEWGGDISFKCSVNGSKEFLSASNSKERSWILGTLGTVGGGILGGYCAGVKGVAIGSLGLGASGYALGAYIDDKSAAGRCCKTISKGKNLDLFILYLNDQKDENGESLWESGGVQRIDPNGTPINYLLDNGSENMGEWEGILAEIEGKYGEDHTGRRRINVLWDEANPTKYIIEAYGHSAQLTLEGGPTKKGDKIDYSKITKIHIEKYQDSDWGEGLDIDFPKTEEGLKEAIRVALLTNMFREDWAGKGRLDYPFSCGRFIGKDGRSLYFDAGEFSGKGTRLLDRKTFKEKYPTIFKDVTQEPVILSRSGYQEEYHNQAFKNESTGSQYIKFLHQMGKGKYWKKS